MPPGLLLVMSNDLLYQKGCQMDKRPLEEKEVFFSVLIILGFTCNNSILSTSKNKCFVCHVKVILNGRGLN